jgi:undecaprenyl-diphosphatase
VIAALIFRDYITEMFASGASLGFAFLVTAGLLAVPEFFSRRAGTASGRRRSAGAAGTPDTAGVKPAGKMKWPDALVIGIFQAVAIIPGVSRSGATLSAALFRKFDRDFAARFSFLLSIPAILGALVLQLKEIAGPPGGAAAGSAAGTGAAPIIAGTLTAAAVGFFSVRFMLKIVRKHSLIVFAVYTAALGILVLIDTFGTHRFF